MTVLVAVQARTGSSRLPGKVLEPIHGRPMLGFQLERMQHGFPDDWDLVVATTTAPGDESVVAVAEAIGVSVFRGSELDVLARYASILDEHPAQTLVRLTGDCPLTDPAIVRATVALHDESDVAYTSNVYPRSYPKGLDVEVVDRGALLTAAAEATEVAEREHVTPFLVRRPERFAMATLFSGDDLGDERWTVDLPEDLDRVRSIVDRLDDPLLAGWRDILAEVGTTPPDPGRIRFRPLPPPAPGSVPWVRSWSAERGHTSCGTVHLAVGNGATRLTIEPRASEAGTGTTDELTDQAAIEAAFETFMAGDVQITR